MDPMTIIALITFAAKNAPDAYAALSRLVGMFIPDSADELDAHADEIAKVSGQVAEIADLGEKGILLLDGTLRLARSYARNEATLDHTYGDDAEGDRAARYRGLVRSIRLQTAAIGKNLSDSDVDFLARIAVQLEALEDEIAVPVA